MKDNLILPVKVTEIINNAVSEITKELTASDKCEYHLDGMKQTYIYGGFDITFRIRHNRFGLATEIPESTSDFLMKSKVKK